MKLIVWYKMNGSRWTYSYIAYLLIVLRTTINMLCTPSIHSIVFFGDLLWHHQWKLFCTFLTTLKLFSVNSIDLVKNVFVTNWFYVHVLNLLLKKILISSLTLLPIIYISTNMISTKLFHMHTLYIIISRPINMITKMHWII